MPLTWREVAAPNFNGVTEAQRLAGTFLNSGFDSAIAALDTFGKDQAARETNALVNEGYRLDNANQGLVNTQLDFTNSKTREFEAARPAAVDLVNQIRSAAALGTPEGRARAAELQAGGSQIFAAAGWAPEDVNAQINGNMGTNAAGLDLNQAHQTVADSNVAREEGLAAKQLLAEVYQTASSPADAAAMIRGNTNISPTVASIALGALENQAGALFGPDADINLAVIDERLAGRGQAGQNPLTPLVDRTEGAGNYNTLYGHAQREGSPFAGTKITGMTLDQLDQFDKGYGDWVKGQVGRFATPGGRYQIVGDTRRRVAKEMGLTGDTLFTPEVQDAMFEHLVQQRLSGPKSMAGKMEGLRQEWEGFKNVPDDVLSAAITAYERGDRTALGGPSQGAQLSPAVVGGGDPVTNAINAALKSTTALSQPQTPGTLEGFVGRTNELNTMAQTILNSVTADSMFGNDALLTELTTRPNKGKSELDVFQDLKERLSTGENDALFSNPNNLISKLNEVKTKYGLDTDMAAAFIGEAIEQRWFGSRWLLGQTTVGDQQLDQLISQYYNKNGKTQAEKLAPAVEQLTASQTRKTASDKLQQLQGDVAKAQQEYANALAREKSRPGTGAKVEAARLRLDALQGQYEQTLSQLDGNALLLSNTASRR